MWKAFASLFVAVAVAMLGIGIISPILPLYAETFSASGLAIGLVFAAFSISRALLGPFVGRFSDRFGRKPMILIGLGVFAAVSLCYSLAATIWQLALVRVVQGAASVMVTPIAQAYVGDITPPGKEGRMMNLFYTSMFMGVAFGPLLGGLLTQWWSFHAAFAGMGILSALSLVLVAITVPLDEQRKRSLAAAPTQRRRSLRELLGTARHDVRKILQVFRHDAVKAILAYVSTRGMWRQGFNAFYPLFAVSMMGWTESQVGLVLSAYFFAGGIFQIPFGYLADRWPRIPQIVFGSFAAPLLLLLIPFVRSTWGVLAVVFAIGALSAFSRASILAIRTQLGRTHGMATLAGLHGSAFASGQAVGPVMFGAVADAMGLGAVFPFGSLLGALGSVAVVLWLRRWGGEISTPQPAEQAATD